MTSLLDSALSHFVSQDVFRGSSYLPGIFTLFIYPVSQTESYVISKILHLTPTMGYLEIGTLVMEKFIRFMLPLNLN